MTKVKLCGIKHPNDLIGINTWCPDYTGFVFAPESKRYLPPHEAKMLRTKLNPAIQSVGVFVNAPIEIILTCLNDHIIDLVQLHGNEGPDYLNALRHQTTAPIIQAFHLSTPADAQRVQKSPADYILLDHKNAGSGCTFDWSLASPLRRPFFLAGGLNADNVSAAIHQLQPFAVDTSSGIETNGQKDWQKIKAFIQAVRSTN